VVDTNVSLPATLISTGLMRKFWVLLAFGAAAYRAEHLQLDLDGLEVQATDGGGEIHGRDALKRLATQADQARASMEELLPVGTPSDWVAIGGVDLFSEYERKVEEVAAKLRVDPPPDPAKARRQVEAVCVAAEASFDPADVPRLTSDSDDDLIVWTALRGGADLLISDDKHVVPDEAAGPHSYAAGDSTVVAVRFGYLIDNYLDEVEWDRIDGRMLPQLYRAGLADR
jgi:hypothetical protein